jgi:hypothetical protein
MDAAREIALFKDRQNCSLSLAGCARKTFHLPGELKMADPRRERARWLAGRRETDSTLRGYAPCEHGASRVVLLPPGYLHHGKELCRRCGVFLRWLPKPQTIARARTNAFKLARLGMCDRLSSWERGFVRNVSSLRKLSPRQQQTVDRLSATYLEGTTP